MYMGVRSRADDIDLNNPEEMQLLLTSMLCNDSSIAEGKELGDPTETALSILDEAGVFHTKRNVQRAAVLARSRLTAIGN